MYVMWQPVVLLQLDRELEENTRQRGIVFIGQRVGSQKCMDAELLRALGLERRRRSVICARVMPYLRRRDCP